MVCKWYARELLLPRGRMAYSGGGGAWKDGGQSKGLDEKGMPASPLVLLG